MRRRNSNRASHCRPCDTRSSVGTRLAASPHDSHATSRDRSPRSTRRLIVDQCDAATLVLPGGRSRFRFARDRQRFNVTRGVVRDYGEIARSVFSAAEVDQLNKTPSHRYAQAFLSCWTKKEALLYTPATSLRRACPVEHFTASQAGSLLERFWPLSCAARETLRRCDPVQTTMYPSHILRSTVTLSSTSMPCRAVADDDSQ